MTIQQALIEAASEANWSPAHIAAAAGVTEAAARKWLSGTPPSGPYMLRLMKELPGFRERLGYDAIPDAPAAVA